jgi:hypothetical protein
MSPTSWFMEMDDAVKRVEDWLRTKVMKDLVFVQIPAYRDSELLATVEDLMQTAAEPTRLRVGMAWQYDEAEEKQERLCGNGATWN